MSLRTRLVVTVTTLLALGLLAASAATYVALRGFLLERVDYTLRYNGYYAVQDIARNLDGQGPSQDPGNPPMPAGDSTPVFAQVLTENGTVRKTYATPGHRPKLPANLPLEKAANSESGVLFTAPGRGSSDERFRVLVLEIPGSAPGYGVMAASLQPVEDTLNGLIPIELIVVSVTLAGVALLAWHAVGRATRPLAEIADDARAIEAGDVARPVRHAGPHTEVGRLSCALNGAFGARRASEERLRRFVADASHELRTPLTSIRGYAELFRSGAGADPEHLSTTMRRIEAEAGRMGTLVDELLLLARLDQGRPLERTPVDLTRLVQESIAEAAAIEPGRDITVESQPAVRVLGDPERLRQVVTNLLANVRSHTPPETPVTVLVTTSEANLARIEVTDSGPGLSAEQRERVFERFYRADASRARTSGGSGLGLSIVSAIAAAHGGRAGVESAPEQGSTFWVELPESGAELTGDSQLGHREETVSPAEL